MKLLQKIKTVAICLLVLVAFSRCDKTEPSQTDGSTEHAHASAEEYYTCPMHPSVRSDGPGACPVCNMSLVKVSGNQTGKDEGFRLTPWQRQLANIEVQEIKSGGIGTANAKVLTGEVILNENSVEAITARIPGRIDKLYIRSKGEQVKKGQPLYQIYSEQLVSVQNEYLLALQQEGINLGELKSEFANSSRQRLLLWGMTDSQIKNLRQSGKPSATLTYFSPVSGTVMDVAALEGSYVQEGTQIMRLANLNSVWVQAQLYPHELAQLNKESDVRVIPEANTKDTLKAEWVLTNPTIETSQQINLVTLKVDNKNGELLPGQMAYVLTGNNKSQKSRGVFVPKSAVIPGQMPMLWIENPDSTFQSRMITLGIQTKDWVEVLDGIHAGERVVVRGAYLLNSEFVLKSGGSNSHQH
ncbi:MAG: efflux RND transporter periplasmic adaptor subunit [Pedobacter sp.]|nr:MAG: efflux RND transporter periplasmic adaptor subunit [Pedobacter sp.]